MASSIEQLVNRNFLRWVAQQKGSASRQKADRLKQKPMLVMSREFGGRGAEIGRKVASRLRFQFHSQDLVHEIARRAKVRGHLVESLDERARDNVEQWVAELMDGESFAPNDYLKNLSKVVISLGRHGKGVIVGRGAHLILDPQRTLRVRAYAPLEHRTKYIAKRHGLPASEARSLVLRVDAERQAFYKQHFNADVADPLLYDLMLNTATVPIAACVEMVVAAFRAKCPA